MFFQKKLPLFYRKIFLKNKIFTAIFCFFLLLFIYLAINFYYRLKSPSNLASFEMVDGYIPFSQESYLRYEKVFKVRLPRNQKGQFVITKIIARSNQIDAFRHAYVSGVVAMKYGNKIATILGNSKELFDDIIYRQSSQEKAMDYWNNAVGRKYGLSTVNRPKLAEKIYLAMINRELIINTNDYRCNLQNK